VGDENLSEPRFFMAANQTRAGIEATREIIIGDAFMRIEADFLEQNNTLRLRHAYGRANRLLIGQTWSTFADVSGIPLTVDLDGPNSSVSRRTVQVRYSQEISDHFRYALALESPEPEITTPDSVVFEESFQSFPDLAGRIRTLGSWGHVQLAGIVRSISVKNAAGVRQDLVGYGGLLSGQVNIGEHSELMYQIVAGEAISSFITALELKGLDVIYNPDADAFETVLSSGGFLSFGHDWDRKFYTYITTGYVTVENKDFESDDAFNYSGYGSINFFWTPFTSIRIGLEYSFGTRVNKDGASGDANRISSIIYYDF
jgi:hypothetical protein